MVSMAVRQSQILSDITTLLSGSHLQHTCPFSAQCDFKPGLDSAVPADRGTNSQSASLTGPHVDGRGSYRHRDTVCFSSTSLPLGTKHLPPPRAQQGLETLQLGQNYNNGSKNVNAINIATC